MLIDEQTIQDLEFDIVRSCLAEQCKSEKAKVNALRIKPFSSLRDVKKEFGILREIQSIYQNDSISFPHSSSEDIDHALKVLRVENGVLTLQELVRVYQLCIGTDALVKFAKKNQDEYPKIWQSCQHIERVQDIIKLIRSILNKNLEIDDKATKELGVIRKQIKSIKIEIDKNFNRVLKQYKEEGFLDSTEETFLDNRRLLVVISAYKRKVQGKIQGVSGKGNFSYVEPGVNLILNKRLDKLIIEESNEIFKILKEITLLLRSENSNLKAFERLLIRFDLFNAKVRFADTYNGIIPSVNSEFKMYWENAIHPILFLKNTALEEDTIGQDFELKQEQRFLVISGPNAGGKSITLKTIGLLQLMFQSGLMVSVNDVSDFCWFDTILSDIGDNQSIENQLSTYSYRLSRMEMFLNQVNASSLVLLDEFGSGSDPELGGALAEVFYEELYSRNCFAVINTHYTNIKILTSKKEEAVNAFMLFDTKELKPLYKLSIGQPGSSFTFEVARLNGIGDDLIKRAQNKVSDLKINLDNLALDLQKEKSKFNKANKLQNKATQESRKLINKYDDKLRDLYEKSNQQHRFFEQQSKFLKAGKKIFDLIGRHKGDETNKELNEAIKKFVAIEKKRVLQVKNPPVLEKQLKSPKIQKPIHKKTSIKLDKESSKLSKPVKVGSRVRIPGYTKTGVVQVLKSKQAEILVGNFMVSIKISDLSVVE